MAAEPVVEDANIYEQLENYPWDSDKEFQGGLKAILGPNPSPSQLQDLTLRAQCFYLSRKTSVLIDFNGYRAYLSSKQSSSAYSEATTFVPIEPPSNTQSNSTPTTQATSPQFQTQAQPAPPDAGLMALGSTPADPTSFNAPTSTSSTTPGGQSGAPYPRSFAEIVALIQSGAPIPGIREIDDTPRGLAASSPSVMPKRRKPWEKDVPEEVIQGRGPGTFGDHRDQQIRQEYPDA